MSVPQGSGAARTPGNIATILTLFFSDIEGSTQHWEHTPKAMSVALQRHDLLVRAAIEGAGGSVFKTVGDAFCAVFPSPTQAVLAAWAVQDSISSENWMDGLELKVRIGIHTGECEEREGDYFGPSVNKVARLGSVGHGGQVLCSLATARLLASSLPSGVELRSLGQHELADIDLPEEIHQLDFPGRPTTFPPLRSRYLAPVTNNLPPETSSLVSRAGEIRDVVELLGAHRVVTVAGSGGIGKTRLALEVARTLVSEMRDGAWLVELAEILDPDSVPGVILSSLGVSGRGERDETEALLEVISDQQRLIVLDNCEHLIDACARICNRVMRRCPETRILATSREPMRIEGEAIYRVPPLSLPPEDASRLSDLEGFGSVELLLQRALAQNPVLRFHDEDASSIASICNRLDGIPLAIELAAARLRSMSVRQLSQRIEDRFAVLTGGNRTSLPRQQTLHAMIDWSYNLLEPSEQMLFRRLSVFRAGFDLDAAEAVCPLGDLSPGEIADLIASLVDKSLVNARVTGSSARYTMLETLHAYSSEALTATPGEEARLKDAHAAYFVAHFEAIDAALRTSSAPSARTSAMEEQENLLKAAETLVGRSGDDPAAVELALRLLGSASAYANSFRENARLRVLLDQALELAGPDPMAARAAALFCKAQLVAYRSTELEDCLAAAVDEARRSGDRRIESKALSMLGALTRQDHYGTLAVEIARQLDEPSTLAMALTRHAASLLRGDSEHARERARSLLTEALETSFRADIDCEAHVRVLLSVIDLEERDLPSARAHLEAMGALLDRYTPPTYLTHVFLENSGWLDLESGNVIEAERRFAYALVEARRAGLRYVTAYALLGLACCAAKLGRLERAAILHGGAQAVIDAHHQTWDTLEDGIRVRDLAQLRDALGDSLDESLLAGSRLSPEDLAAFALAEFQLQSADGGREHG